MAGQSAMLAGPAYLAGSATNVTADPGAGFYNVVTQVNIANVTSGAVTFTMYRDTTGGSTGGKELFKAVSIPANTTVQYSFGNLVLGSGIFLVGLASATQSITCAVMGTKNVSSA